MQGMMDWRRKKVAQLGLIAEFNLKEDVLERERIRHIHEHIQYTTCQLRTITGTVMRRLSAPSQVQSCTVCQHRHRYTGTVMHHLSAQHRHR